MEPEKSLLCSLYLFMVIFNFEIYIVILKSCKSFNIYANLSNVNPNYGPVWHVQQTNNLLNTSTKKNLIDAINIKQNIKNSQGEKIQRF